MVLHIITVINVLKYIHIFCITFLTPFLVTISQKVNHYPYSFFFSLDLIYKRFNCEILWILKKYNFIKEVLKQMWKRPGYASIKAVVSSFYLPREIKKKKRQVASKTVKILQQIEWFYLKEKLLQRKSNSGIWAIIYGPTLAENFLNWPATIKAYTHSNELSLTEGPTVCFWLCHHSLQLQQH